MDERSKMWTKFIALAQILGREGSISRVSFELEFQSSGGVHKTCCFIQRISDCKFWCIIGTHNQMTFICISFHLIVRKPAEKFSCWKL